MRKAALVLLSLFGFLVLVGLLVLGYLGFIPGLSTIFGSDKPIDLGVKYSEEDFDKYNEITNTKISYFSSNDTANSIKFANSAKFVDTKLSQELVSARINYSKWKYMPIKNVQIKFGDGNKLEVSGNLKKDTFIEFLKVVDSNLGDSEINKVADYLKAVPLDPALYIDSTVSVTNNKASIQINKVTVGRLDVDINDYGGSGVAENLTHTIFNNVKEFYGEKVMFEEGNMIFSGNAPTTIEEAK